MNFFFQSHKDKTFGLKNKKGSKQQKFIQTVQKQVSNMGAQNQRSALDQNLERQKKKEEEQRKKDELAVLFKPVLQTVAAGSLFFIYFLTLKTIEFKKSYLK